MEMNLELKATETKIKKEMKHFMALNVMSIAFGGIALALAISALTVNALALRTTDFTTLLNLFSNIGISFVVAGLAFWFLISSADVLSKFEEIQEEKNGELTPSREKLTERVVKLIGLYREKKPQIRRMILVSKIAGLCFFANALIQTVMLIPNLNSSSVVFATAIGGIIVSVVMGVVGFFLPSSFHKYAVCWDERLIHSDDVEKKILSFMEEPL
ncbi:MAG: hypothetical protein JXA75_07175 [Candidatus Thermoplasmatota archaeon]|nr:hypothetical protein [Candidatus Thermoplasmatota archaeon]